MGVRPIPRLSTMILFDDFELPRIKYLVVPSVVNACIIIVHKVLMTKYNTHLCVRDVL